MSLLVVLAVFTTPAAAQGQTTALFLDSEQGDVIGQGLRQTWTPAHSAFSAMRWGNGIRVLVVGSGSSFEWSLVFNPPEGMPLTVGTYESATHRMTATSPELDVSGWTSCSTQTGRFIVREISLATNGTVLAFAADFEQHCGDAAPGLFGAIRCNATIADTVPFGGQYPSYRLTIAPSAHGRVRGAAGLIAEAAVQRVT